jgi:hypothetical protein
MRRPPVVDLGHTRTRLRGHLRGLALGAAASECAQNIAGLE